MDNLEFNDMYNKLKKDYDEIILNEYTDFNKKRKSFLLKQMIVSIIIVIIAIYIMIVNPFQIAMIPILLLFGIVINIIIFNFKFNKEKSKFNVAYKKLIIVNLVSDIFNDEVSFDFENGITEKEYYSTVYKEQYDEFKSSDLFVLNKNRLFFSEVLTENISRDDENRETRTTVFKGLAGQKVLDKSINTNFSVLRNLMFLNNKVKLDSNEFEKIFDVECVNNILAVRFLTADIMLLLIELYNTYDMQFEFSIVNNIMYYRIRSYEEFFEIPNMNSGFNKEHLYKNYEMLTMIKNLTDKINEIVKEIEI